MVLRFVAHSKRVLKIAAQYGWLPGARYTNLRDIREFSQVGFIDIDWNHYSFKKHLAAVKSTNPLMTVARDIERLSDLSETLDQAHELRQHCRYVIIVPKHPSLATRMDALIPRVFALGYSVPTRYGGTQIPTKAFTRPVHLLGGRPEVQRRLAASMPVVSVDCNRFTLDAAFGDYFDGEKFRPHPRGGYVKCIRDSIKNINKIWIDYSCGSLINAS
jgi:hypothetical protein